MLGGCRADRCGVLLRAATRRCWHFCMLIDRLRDITHTAATSREWRRAPKVARTAMAVSIASGIDHSALLTLLADGRLHSGEWLARRTRREPRGHLEGHRAAAHCGASTSRRCRGAAMRCRRRSNCWRRGASVPRWRGRRAIQLRSLELLFDVDSTNTRLLAARCASVRVTRTSCLSELQHAGRGPPRPPLDRAIRGEHRAVDGMVVSRMRRGASPP